MGSSRRLKKKYKTPNNPFEKERILEEFAYLGKYGLRNKKEFWKHRYQLSKFRQHARETRALAEPIQQERFKELSASIQKFGLIGEDAQTDEILSLTIENVLDRRLQTFVHKLGLAKSIIQARQLVVHGHIAVGGKVIDSPSYLVKKADETHIGYALNSPFSKDETKIWSEGKSAPSEEA
jgi:small subunit ribosomal protein S4